MAAAVAHAEVDDSVAARGGERAHLVAKLAVGVVAGAVEKTCSELDFERVGTIEQVDDRRWSNRLARE